MPTTQAVLQSQIGAHISLAQTLEELSEGKAMCEQREVRKVQNMGKRYEESSFKDWILKCMRKQTCAE
eukprot:1145687-Pelagomonas_calceolata.AAC.6